MKAEIRDILSKLKEDDVSFVDLLFNDFLGNIKSSTIPIYRVADALANGVWIDGSSIEGFARIHESDMYLVPDLSTYTLLPWRNHVETGRVARFICDVYTPNHEPFEGDPRYILKKAEKEAREMGFDYFTGPECEFFLFRKVNDEIVRSTKGNGYYFDLIMDDTYAIKREVMEALYSMGVLSETSTHEVADGQHEIDIRYGKAMQTADNTITLKMATKFIAHRHGYHATFMPKPFYGTNGNGMHIHQSLWRDGANTFTDPADGYGLSKTAYSFLAGQMKYAREISGILAPTVNSYKRLTPGFEAPVYISWARINRSALIRVPKVSKGLEANAARIEIRCPDPSASPYLAFAVLLKAGIEGIKEKLRSSKPVEENVFDFDEEMLTTHDIAKLPSSLIEAIGEIENGRIVKEAFGGYTWKRYIDAKTAEWDKFRTWVTDWEVNRYLTTL